MLRVFSLFGNAAMLFSIVFMLISEGAPARPSEMALIALLVTIPVASIISLLRLVDDQEWLLSLYFQRLRLEQKEKIRILKAKRQES